VRPYTRGNIEYEKKNKFKYYPSSNRFSKLPETLALAYFMLVRKENDRKFQRRILEKLLFSKKIGESLKTCKAWNYANLKSRRSWRCFLAGFLKGKESLSLVFDENIMIISNEMNHSFIFQKVLNFLKEKIIWDFFFGGNNFLGKKIELAKVFKAGKAWRNLEDSESQKQVFSSGTYCQKKFQTKNSLF